MVIFLNIYLILTVIFLKIYFLPNGNIYVWVLFTKRIPTGLAIFTFMLKWLTNLLKSPSIRLCKSNAKCIYDTFVNNVELHYSHMHLFFYLFIFLLLSLSHQNSFTPYQYSYISLNLRNCISEYVYMTKFMFIILRSHSYEPSHMRTKILLTL
jgi:hypothetical protein